MVLFVVDLLFIVTPIVGVCNCSMFCCTVLYVHSSIAIILMGKKELVALLNLSSWCLVMVEWLSLAVSWGCLRFGIVVFPDYTHLLFLAVLSMGICLELGKITRIRSHIFVSLHNTGYLGGLMTSSLNRIPWARQTLIPEKTYISL